MAVGEAKPIPAAERWSDISTASSASSGTGERWSDMSDDASSNEGSSSTGIDRVENDPSAQQVPSGAAAGWSQSHPSSRPSKKSSKKKSQARKTDEHRTTTTATIPEGEVLMNYGYPQLPIGHRSVVTMEDLGFGFVDASPSGRQGPSPMAAFGADASLMGIVSTSPTYNAQAPGDAYVTPGSPACAHSASWGDASTRTPDMGLNNQFAVSGSPYAFATSSGVMSTSPCANSTHRAGDASSRVAPQLTFDNCGTTQENPSTPCKVRASPTGLMGTDPFTGLITPGKSPSSCDASSRVPPQHLLDGCWGIPASPCRAWLHGGNNGSCAVASSPSNAVANAYVTTAACSPTAAGPTAETWLQANGLPSGADLLAQLEAAAPETYED